VNLSNQSVLVFTATIPAVASDQKYTDLYIVRESVRRLSAKASFK
jgi:hypothetical protein